MVSPVCPAFPGLAPFAVGHPARLARRIALELEGGKVDVRSPAAGRGGFGEETGQPHSGTRFGGHALAKPQRVPHHMGAGGDIAGHPQSTSAGGLFARPPQNPRSGDLEAGGGRRRCIHGLALCSQARATFVPPLASAPGSLSSPLVASSKDNPYPTLSGAHGVRVSRALLSSGNNTFSEGRFQFDR